MPCRASAKARSERERERERATEGGREGEEQPRPSFRVEAAHMASSEVELLPVHQPEPFLKRL